MIGSIDMFKLRDEVARNLVRLDFLYGGPKFTLAPCWIQFPSVASAESLVEEALQFLGGLQGTWVVSLQASMKALQPTFLDIVKLTSEFIKNDISLVALGHAHNAVPKCINPDTAFSQITGKQDRGFYSPFSKHCVLGIVQSCVEDYWPTCFEFEKAIAVISDALEFGRILLLLDHDGHELDIEDTPLKSDGHVGHLMRIRVFGSTSGVSLRVCSLASKTQCLKILCPCKHHIVHSRVRKLRDISVRIGFRGTVRSW